MPTCLILCRVCDDRPDRGGMELAVCFSTDECFPNPFLGRLQELAHNACLIAMCIRAGDAEQMPWLSLSASRAP